MDSRANLKTTRQVTQLEGYGRNIPEARYRQEIREEHIGRDDRRGGDRWKNNRKMLDG